MCSSDLMICDDMHAMDDTFDVTYARFIFPCDTLPLDNIHHMVNVDHVKLFSCDDIAIDMPCYEPFTFPVVACIMMKNCSSKCFACNDEINVCCEATNLMNNCSFPKFVHNNDIPLGMLCYKCFIKSPIAIDNEFAPIAFSTFGNFAFCHEKHVPMYSFRTYHVNIANLFDTNGVV